MTYGRTKETYRLTYKGGSLTYNRDLQGSLLNVNKSLLCAKDTYRLTYKSDSMTYSRDLQGSLLYVNKSLLCVNVLGCFVCY